MIDKLPFVSRPQDWLTFDLERGSFVVELDLIHELARLSGCSTGEAAVRIVFQMRDLDRLVDISEGSDHVVCSEDGFRFCCGRFGGSVHCWFVPHLEDDDNFAAVH